LLTRNESNFKLELKNLHCVTESNNEKETRPVTDRGNKFNSKLQESRNYSVKNLQTNRYIKKPEMSTKRPASTERSKPTEPQQITAMYNVKMNFNIGKEIFNNNFISNLSKGPTTKSDKLSMTKKIYESKGKDYIKLEKPAQAMENRFYQSSPDRFTNARLSTTSSRRNSSHSKVGFDNSLKRNGSESKMYTGYNITSVRGNPSSGRFLQKSDSKGMMKANEFNVDLWSKKNNIKKKSSD
jgi:hypothetical protein